MSLDNIQIFITLILDIIKVNLVINLLIVLK